jgi:methionyl-tRNA formyltransferase
VIKPDDVNQSAMVDQIRRLTAEAFVVIAFGQKLGQGLLKDAFAINLHASLLPKYRGAAPINWAMINGETETGLSVITVAPRMDAGDVLGQASVTIDPRETAGELHDRLAAMGPDAVIETLRRKSEGTLQACAQDDRLATAAPKLTKADGTVCFDQPALRVRCRVHGLTPWPGCWIRIGERSLRLHRVEDLPQGSSANSQSSLPAAGTVLDDLTVQCAAGCLRLLDVQPASGKLMTFAAYVNGHGVRAGERCTPGCPA